MKSSDFSKNLLLKILRNLTFFRENPVKSADFSANFDFPPAKSADFSANSPLKIPRNFAFFSAKYQKPCMMFALAENLIFPNFS